MIVEYTTSVKIYDFFLSLENHWCGKAGGSSLELSKSRVFYFPKGAVEGIEE